MSLEFENIEQWVKATLPDISELIMGQSPSSSDVNDVGEGVCFFQGKSEFGKIHPTPKKYCTAPKKIAMPKDILLSIRAPVGPTNIANRSACIGRGLAAIRASNSVDYKYLFYFFRSIEPWMSEQGTGSTFKAISGQFLKELPVLLPPLAEQREIANRLDTLLAQVDSLKGRLDALPAILKRFRQSVLAAAVSGKLTEEWRLQNSIEDWKSATIDKLVKVINGKAFPSKEYQDSGVKLLRPGNLHISGKVTWTNKNTTYIPECWIEKRPELILKKGALLMNLTAQSLKDEFLGRVCTLDCEDEALLNQRICSFESKLSYDIKPYLCIFFRSPIFREYVATLDSGSLIKHLNVKDIKSHILQLPSELEQTEIVRRVEQLFAFADQVEQRVKQAQNRVNHLTQSILAKAFRGELTADWRKQHPTLISGEHSASALLTRIRAERAAQTPAKRTPRKKASA